VAFGRVVERLDEGVFAEHLLHPRALDADAAPVYQPDLVEAGLVRGPQVLIHNRRDIARREGMQVERPFDGDWVGVHATCYLAELKFGPTTGAARYLPFSYTAVTVVRMPPRGVKAPTTFIRRGLQAATRSSRIWLVAFS
jgi:hypothetical protein